MASGPLKTYPALLWPNDHLERDSIPRGKKHSRAIRTSTQFLDSEYERETLTNLLEIREGLPTGLTMDIRKPLFDEPVGAQRLPCRPDFVLRIRQNGENLRYVAIETMGYDRSNLRRRRRRRIRAWRRSTTCSLSNTTRWRDPTPLVRWQIRCSRNNSSQRSSTASHRTDHHDRVSALSACYGMSKKFEDIGRKHRLARQIAQPEQS